MKVIKKSQIAVLSILLMVGVAGYINYKYNPTREKNLGQTMYVNGKDSFTYDKVSIYSEDKSNSENDDAKTTSASAASAPLAISCSDSKIAWSMRFVLANLS